MKIYIVAFMALLSISLINSMQQEKKQDDPLQLILTDAENRLLREKGKLKKPNNPSVRTSKTGFSSSINSGNRLSNALTLGVQTDKDFFERRIELIKALQAANNIPALIYGEQEGFSLNSLCMINLIIGIGNSIGGISHQNPHLQQKDLSQFVISLMHQHPLLDRNSSPLLCISSRASINKFKGKYNEFESACKAINTVLSQFPIPQACKDSCFFNILETIESFQHIKDFKDKQLRNIIDNSFPQSILVLQVMRLELINAIDKKNEQLKHQLESLYPHQHRILEDIKLDRQDYNSLKKEINYFFSDDNSMVEDCKKTLLQSLENRNQPSASVITAKEKKNTISLPAVENKKPIDKTQKNEIKNNAQESNEKKQKEIEKKPENDPTQPAASQNPTLKKEPILSSQRIALLTGLGFAGCFFLYMFKHPETINTIIKTLFSHKTALNHA